jgi:hypothetical protein
MANIALANGYYFGFNNFNLYRIARIGNDDSRNSGAIVKRNGLLLLRLSNQRNKKEEY